MNIKCAVTEEQAATNRDATMSEAEEALKAIFKKHGVQNKFFLLFLLHTVDENEDGYEVESDCIAEGRLMVDEYLMMLKEIMKTVFQPPPYL